MKITLLLRLKRFGGPGRFLKEALIDEQTWNKMREE